MPVKNLEYMERLSESLDRMTDPQELTDLAVRISNSTNLTPQDKEYALGMVSEARTNLSGGEVNNHS